MNPSFKTPSLIAASLLSLATALPLHAESLGSAASSAASAGSSAAGSASDSIKGSSNSSTGNTQVADGEYRVIEMAQAADRPGFIELQLRGADAAAGAFTLIVPQQALKLQTLAVGDIVQARNRDYGLEFARVQATGTRETFFLALNDAAMREMRSHALSL